MSGKVHCLVAEEHDSSASFETFYSHFQKITMRLKLRYSNRQEKLLKALFSSTAYLSAFEIQKVLKEVYHTRISLTHLYTLLAFLEKLDLLHVVITPSQNVKQYRLKRSFHQDHLVCIKCGSITPFYHPNIEKEQDEILLQHRFLGIHHTMILYGVCQRCHHE
ncbi:Fur family transcriptional regulator [Sulfurospirillum barnesii]|uniref:Fur family transcriptional regulator n=1 Tax=Sulfurospirillum barnesii TaxID=44674 RepID=UPI00030D0803|nr:transcriptional repressor [Sulfurospirillum barnesii]